MSNGPTPPLSSNTGGQFAQTLSRRETDANYGAVVAILASRWRVVLCRDGKQYILQCQFGAGLHKAVWRGMTYHTTQRSLIRDCARRDLLSSATAQKAISCLPSLARECAVQRAQK
jgi:hypothetical protein